MVEVQRARAPRFLGLPVVAWLLVVIALAAVFGVGYAAWSSHGAAPAFPATPPGARRLWASQQTPELGSNQITSLALYRVEGTPAEAIAYYRHALPGHGGSIGKFDIVVRNANAAYLPTGLQDLPSVFADGKGAARRVEYAFTEYNKGSDDIAIAVDVRHPQGPTLVFVEMLSS